MAIYKIVDTSVSTAKNGRADDWNHRHGNPTERLFGKVPNGYARNVDQIAILKKYHLSGFEYGNWLNNNERVEYLYQCENSLAALAMLLRTDNLGLDMLHIAFGARGRAGALAHYEPKENAINLTKEHGESSLAHEFGHSLDYNLGRYLDQDKLNAALSGGAEFLPIGQTPSYQNSTTGALRVRINKIIDFLAKTLDVHILKEIVPIRKKMLNGEALTLQESLILSAYPFSYYRQRTEIFARAFEQYVATKYNLTKADFLVKPLDTYYKRFTQWTYSEFYAVEKDFDLLVKDMGDTLNGKKIKQVKEYVPMLGPDLDLEKLVPGLLDVFQWRNDRLILKPQVKIFSASRKPAAKAADKKPAARTKSKK